MSGAPEGATQPTPGVRDQARPVALLAWLDQGTDLVETLAARLTDDDVARACRLPGWTRAHLLTHLARNADGTLNLVRWATTGIATPMYPSDGHRAADIAAGAGRDAADLLADLRRSDAHLATALRMTTGPAWGATVRDRAGRDLPAVQIPWLRVREVWIHAVDLDAGVGFADLPADLVDALLDDVAAGFSARSDAPEVLLAPDDRDRSWPVGPVTTTPDTGPPAVRGPAAALLGWLLGRCDGADLRPAGELPAVPPWL